MVREDIPWLVKSSGRILGPFPSTKIIDLLRTREISVLDEVSSPLRRWQTIQYHEEFKEIIDSLRKSNLSEKTEATWTPTGVTSNLTQTLTDISGGELTDELSEDMIGFTNTAKEIVVHNVQEQTHTPSPPPGGRYQTQQGQSTAIQRQVEKTTRGLWLVTIVVLVGVALFIVQKRLARGGLDGRPSLSTLTQSVVNNIAIGQFADALRELKAFYPDPGQAGEQSIYYGLLLLQVEGQTTISRRLLNSVITNRRADMKQAYDGLGIADMLDGQLDSAQDNFDRALNLEPGYIPAIVNAGITALMKGDYHRAKALSLRALQLNSSLGEPLLTLAEAQLGIYKGSNNPNDLTQVNKLIKDFHLRQWDYSPELGFYSLYFDFLKQDKMLDDKLRDYLDRDPQLTMDHRHSLYIYHSRAPWKNLARLCERMGEKLGATSRTAVFLASCYSQEQRWDQARRSIDRAVQQSPKDALVQAWTSYIQKESGDENEASVMLGRASESNRRGEYALPVLLQARFCAMAGDNDCAKDLWQRLYERDLDFLPAISGLAWVNANKSAHGEANKLLEKGLRTSPEYKPLLQLRQKAQREGWYAPN
jgi:tetratricopeptide (TPR) repeat protein